MLLKYQGKDVAVITVESKWKPDKPLEAKMCYGTSSIEHPGVSMISMERRKYETAARSRVSPSPFAPSLAPTLRGARHAPRG